MSNNSKLHLLAWITLSGTFFFSFQDNFLQIYIVLNIYDQFQKFLKMAAQAMDLQSSYFLKKVATLKQITSLSQIDHMNIFVESCSTAPRLHKDIKICMWSVWLSEAKAIKSQKKIKTILRIWRFSRLANLFGNSFLC